MVSCTRTNPMTWSERLVYSFLVFLRGHQRGGTFKKVARETGLNLQRTVPRTIRRLAGRGLVENKDGRWCATEPPEPGWFGWVRDQDRPWWRRLAYWWLYRPGPALKPRQAAVWSLALSCQRPMTVAGLARLLNMDRNTVRKTVADLKDQGLFHNMMPVLPEDKRSLFRDRPSTALRASAKCSGVPEAQRTRITAALDAVQAAMQRKGWTDKDIDTFCGQLFRQADGGPASVLWRVVLDLPKIFQEAQGEHEANVARGKYPKATNCKGLMRIKAARALVKAAKAYSNTPVRGTFLDF
jgi:predicted DNA-binding transcriptional regulator